jgi:predicted  nucleic acid-binding Zn-ribbon protein
MEATVTQYVDHKTELEQHIAALEMEQSSLISDISALKERLTTLEMERHASFLYSEVEALRTEKAVLEEKVSSYSVQSVASSEGYQV